MRTFPFSPKSSSSLEIGDFWAIKLSNGRYACGRVIGRWPKGHKGYRKGFLGGLLNWCSDSEPSSEAIAGAKTLIQGGMDTNSLAATNSLILGNRAIELDNIEEQIFIEYPDNETPYIYKGLRAIRKAKKSEINLYSTVSVFGRFYLRERANYEFGEK